MYSYDLPFFLRIPFRHIHVGAHGQTNNLAPLETDILGTFSACGPASEQF